MAESIDELFLARVRSGDVSAGPSEKALDSETAIALFGAQIQSRHLDFAGRWLQTQGAGFYTIGSSGHEANAAVGLVTRVEDPALLHYRSGGFYAARAAKAGDSGIRDVLLGMVAAAADPISGGRHKVFGHPGLHVIPQTSTIASHLPRAVGLAFSLGSLHDLSPTPPWPADGIVVCSLGDASVNHSTAQGAFNAAGYLAHRGIATPLLFVCEDNGIGISTKSPVGWIERRLQALPGVTYFRAESAQPDLLLGAVEEAVGFVRDERRPAMLHLSTVRFLGHAGSDVEIAYRSKAEIVAEYDRDPLLATAGFLIRHGMLSADEVVDRYEAMRSAVMEEAKRVLTEEHLGSRQAVMAPLEKAGRAPEALAGEQEAGRVAPRNEARIETTGAGPGSRYAARSYLAGGTRSAVAGRAPEALAGEREAGRVAPRNEARIETPVGQLTLAQSINAALAELMRDRPDALVFGEDVAVKGGVYGVTRGLRKQFGGRRVFDTLLDEQTILGTALGAALMGLLPIPEIQYLAYLHNAEDQLRGEGASLRFFSDSQYANPMVVRIAGLAYQRGFGGHFHNDNSVAVLRDIPGLVLCVPSHPQDAPGLLRSCAAIAEAEGRVCVYLEPIALYHTRDLYEPGDDLWTAPATDANALEEFGAARSYGEGEDLLVVTFGNGVPMSLRAARSLEREGIGVTVLDLRWLAPLPVADLLAYARRFSRVLVADETRHSGGVSEAVVAALVDGGYAGKIARVNSADSFVPLGPATQYVLLSESDIEQAMRQLSRS
ncbi:MAG: transketolase C-terminal domain-containing protein [Nocardioidaceae bacterium]